MPSTSDFKRAAAFSILILLIASPCLCQLQQVPFDAILFDPFVGSTQGYPESACDCYVGKNAATWKIYTTELCKVSNIVGIMRSEIDAITGDPTFKNITSLPAPGQYQYLITTDNLGAGLTSNWDLIVGDLAAGTVRFQKKITKPSGLSAYKLTSTDKYFVIFYQTNTENMVSEYIMPIYKTNGTKLWTEAMQYIPSYNRTSGDMVDAKMVIDYPKSGPGSGDRFFVVWEWARSGAVSIKRKIIGPSLSDTGTEGDIESLSAVNVPRLEGLGIVNGNEFVIYSTHGDYRILNMWRKNLGRKELVSSLDSYIGKEHSLPYYKGVYVVGTLGGGKIVLAYSQVSSSATNVMYKVFNDNGSSASTSGNPVVISLSDIEVNGVVHEDWTLFMAMGPVSGVWYLGEINFAHS